MATEVFTMLARRIWACHEVEGGALCGAMVCRQMAALSAAGA